MDPPSDKNAAEVRICGLTLKGIRIERNWSIADSIIPSKMGNVEMPASCQGGGRKVVRTAGLVPPTMSADPLLHQFRKTKNGETRGNCKQNLVQTVTMSPYSEIN